ncbi:uncharacterized protein, partial [Temnothorax nylanderi]|uniref:uncharacterized protein n=1 Tax=Temnothorax nylanderi TaxID=102681 RepID=UPI003A85E0A2
DMTPVPQSCELKQTRTCYLPHHGVLKAAGDEVKIRVVFNGSAQLTSGDSLNRHLYTGPNLLPTLGTILTRWRQHQFVMVTDIAKMYRQILVHPDDRDLQRILWRKDRAEAVSGISPQHQTACLVDPLGWLAPVVVRAKILIQSLWLQRIEWDQPLCPEDHRAWQLFRRELPLLEKLRVPRWLNTGGENLRMEIHGFADASERAIAAVAYLKVTNDCESKISLLQAKTRVALLRQVSLPRLELCAAALLVRSSRDVEITLDLSGAEKHLWSDSKVALVWIQGHPSKWKTRLLRVTAWGLRWLNVLQSRHKQFVTGILTPQELEDAEQRWIRIVQEAWFADELQALARGQALSRRSSILKMHPIIDEKGILRVGGRLKHAILSRDERHPVILPRHSHLTNLIVDAYHRRALHGSVQLTLGLLRQRFWIPGGRMKHTSGAPGGGIRLHRRSIHSSLQALRIQARSMYGAVQRPGDQFIGADAQLRALFLDAIRDYSIANTLANDGVQWRFNPPSAPHFGGIWEAAVKSTKHHLRRVIGDATLTYEELSTFLAQVEGSSSPYTGTFLIGAAISAVPEPSLAEEPTGRLSRWQLLQQLRDHFWKRWSSEYLQALNSRQKWWTKDDNPRVGDLCLVRSEQTAPTKWPLARVTAIHPGEDEQVRVVTIRTAATTLKRPTTKIILLPRVGDPEDI